MGRPRYPGQSITADVKKWYVIKHGNVVRIVDLSMERFFPELEDKDMYYVAWG